MTDLLVLGLLATNGALSGYDIQTAMESSQTDTWAYVKPASIYYALKKLAEKNYVSLQKVETTGHRTRAIYEITDAGKKHFQHLIAKGLEKNSIVFPANLYSALTFIEDLPAEKALHHLNIQFQNIEQLYRQMNAVKQLKISLDAYPEHVQLIFENIFRQCQLQLDTLKAIKEYLEKSK
ncbi:PadR family transcriptional regulator [Pediococcus acidilactici]